MPDREREIKRYLAAGRG